MATNKSADIKVKYAVEFACKTFEGKNQKDAYLKGMKWYATNVLARDELHKVQISVEKIVPNAIKLHMYVAIDEQEVREQQCSICKEAHRTLFWNGNYNCSSCNVNAYCKRLEDKIKTARYWCQEKIKQYL